MSRDRLPKKSVIVACDVTSRQDLERLVTETCDIPGIGGYKIGFSLGLKYGLPSVVEEIRRYTGKAVIYDHQKGGTDVPHTGEAFAEVMSESRIDYAILFPFAGPSAETAWINALRVRGVTPIVGAIMTTPDFLEDQGGYIGERSVRRIFEVAISLGVTDFVLPGNKPRVASVYRALIEERASSPAYFLPGLGAQGGDIASCAEVMGERWHAIVGRTIFSAKDVKSAALALSEEISPRR